MNSFGRLAKLSKRKTKVETFDLSINVPSNKSLHSTLIVTDFKGQDSSTIEILGLNDTIVYSYLLNSSITVTNNDKSNSPKLSKIRLNSFSGIIDWVVTAN